MYNGLQFLFFLLGSVHDSELELGLIAVGAVNGEEKSENRLENWVS